MMRRTVLVFSLLFVFTKLEAQHVSLNKDELKDLKELVNKDPAAGRLYADIQRQAERSLAEDPAPIVLIQSQGILMGDPRKMASLKALEDVRKIFSLALAFKISGDRKYLDRSAAFLSKWAEINKPDGNPINETKLEDLVFAYDLIKEDLKKTDKDRISRWLKAMAEAESVHPSGFGDKGTAVNNWNSHRIKMMTMIAYTLNDDKLKKKAEEELVLQLGKNLNADGSTHDFFERDALNYHIFSVEPLLKTIIVIERATGKNYFEVEGSKGGSIKKSVDFLVQYMNGSKTHKEFLNSKVKFDRERASNNEKGFQVSDFIPAKGIVALTPAVYFDKGYMEVVNKADPADTPYFDFQILLNRVRKKTIK